MIPESRVARDGSVLCGMKRSECRLLVRCGKLSRIVGPGGGVEVYKGGDCREKQKNEAVNASRLSGDVSLICCLWSHTPGIAFSMFPFLLYWQKGNFW